MAFVWGAGGSQLTPEQIAARRQITDAMILQGAEATPIRSPWQGAARVTQAMLGGLEAGQLDRAQRDNAASERAMIESWTGGTPSAPTAAVSPGVAQVAAAAGDPAAAIASIESGGKYDTLGPMTGGDRAYGKYQIMGANVPQWTKAHLGQEMTPDQFLASPQAQDAVFKGQFGQYSQKYGPEGAARAWFAGEGGMNNPNAKDVLGTTVANYAKKFNTAMGADPAALPQNAGPAQYQAPAPTAKSGPSQQALISAIASPYTSEGTKKIAGIMLQRQMTEDQLTPVDLGGKVVMQNRRGQVVNQYDKTEPVKAPTIVDGPPDPQTGLPTKGWMNPQTQTFTPLTLPAAANATPSTIPPVPPGVDPKVWREQHSKDATTNALPAPFDETAKVRGEVTQLPSYKNVAQAAPIYKSMVDAAGRNTKASDLNLVYGLGKIMDPGSVVREGEMVMVKNAAGLPEWLVGAVNALNGGAALTPETRKAIMAEAHGRMQSYKGLFDQDTSMYRGIAERRRMNTADVIPEFGSFEPWALPAAVVPPAAAAPVAPPDRSAIEQELRRRGKL